MNIALIGYGPLSFFVARELEGTVARHAHTSVAYFAPEKLPNLGDYAIDRANRFIKPDQVFKYVDVRNAATVRSVSLGQRHIVTTQGVEPFDLIMIDQTPAYSAQDLEEVGRATQKLTRQLSSNARAARAAIRLAGEGAAVWQLALCIKEYLQRDGIGGASVEVEKPRDRDAWEFLQNNGILRADERRRPGFTVAAPAPLLGPRSIKGLVVDSGGYAVTDQHRLAKGHQFVVVRGGEELTMRNMWRPESVLAKHYASQLERLSVNGRPAAMPLESPALLLEGSNGVMTKLGRKADFSLGARAALALERQATRRLFR
jgi:hypothetical protein